MMPYPFIKTAHRQSDSSAVVPPELRDWFDSCQHGTLGPRCLEGPRLHPGKGQNQVGQGCTLNDSYPSSLPCSARVWNALSGSPSAATSPSLSSTGNERRYTS